MQIEINGMTKVPGPVPNKQGDVILAYFDATVGPFTLAGCALVRIYNRERCKGLIVWFPKVEVKGGRRGISVNDRALILAVKDAAAKVFVALSGEVNPKLME